MYKQPKDAAAQARRSANSSTGRSRTARRWPQRARLRAAARRAGEADRRRTGRASEGRLGKASGTPEASNGCTRRTPDPSRRRPRYRHARPSSSSVTYPQPLTPSCHSPDRPPHDRSRTRTRATPRAATTAPSCRFVGCRAARRALRAASSLVVLLALSMRCRARRARVRDLRPGVLHHRRMGSGRARSSARSCRSTARSSPRSSRC